MRCRLAAQAHLEAAIEFHQADLLLAVNAVGRGTVDLVLTTGEAVEVKRWRVSYLLEKVALLEDQLTNYRNPDHYTRVTVEFAQTKTDPVTQEVADQVIAKLAAGGRVDLSEFIFTITP